MHLRGGRLRMKRSVGRPLFKTTKRVIILLPGKPPGSIMVLRNQHEVIRMSDYQYAAGDIVRLYRVTPGQWVPAAKGECAAYKISGVLGRGRSCEGYTAEEADTGIPVTLKRLAPLGACNPGSEVYEQAVKRLDSAYSAQKALLSPETINATAFPLGLFRDQEGMAWTAVSARAGTVFSDVLFLSLHELLKTVLFVSEQVNEIHKKGMLVLDLKAENILVSNSAGTRGILFFDFDSFLSMIELKTALETGGEIAISSTDGESAPELSLLQADGEGLEQVGIQSDFYPIGCLLFSKLFGRLPTVREITFDMVDWTETKLPQNESRRSLDLSVIEELKMFFEKTITSSMDARYTNDDDLLEALRDLLSATSPERPHSFISNEIAIGPTTPYYVRQDKELDELTSFFAENAGQNAVALIVGDVSGVGKTELVREFAKENGCRYDAVEFTVFHEGKGFDGILDQCAFQGENQDKKKALLEGNQRVLLIIDNYDQEHALPLPPMANVHLLLTTRYNTSGFDGAKYIPLNSCREFGLEIFESVYQGMEQSLSTKQKELADKMLHMVEYHPFFADICARELAEYYPSENGFEFFLKQMEEKRLPAGGAIEARKDKRYGEKSGRGNMQGFVEGLFKDLLFHSFDDIEEKIFYLLSQNIDDHWNQTALCILAGDCRDICEGQPRVLAQTAINRLASRHWIRKSEDSEYGKKSAKWLISLHPIIGRLLVEKYQANPDTDCGFAINWLGQNFSDRKWGFSHYPSTGFIQRMRDKTFIVEPGANNQPSCGQNMGKSDINGASMFSVLPRFFPKIQQQYLHEKLLVLLLYDYDRQHGFWFNEGFREDFLLCMSQIIAFQANIHKLVTYDPKTWFFCRARTKSDAANLFFLYFPDIDCIEPVIRCESGYESVAEKRTFFDITEIKQCADVSILMYSLDDRIQSTSIPADIGGLPVVSIGNLQMLSSSNLQTVSLPDTISAIDKDAFDSCRRLADIKFPADLKEIGTWAFANCSSLANIILPNGLKDIDFGAFTDCFQLKNVKLPNGVKSISSEMFDGCVELINVEIPNSVIQIESGAFSDCRDLKDITLPPKLNVIKNSAFMGCSALTKIYIPDGVTDIEYQCFRNCILLNSVRLPETLKHIHWSAFEGCSNLRHIDFPDKVETIEKFAFEDCCGLEEVKLPGELKVIEQYAFHGCCKIKRISIPNGIEYIDDNTFSECIEIEEVLFPNRLKQIGEFAFDGCTNLKAVDFPETLTAIREGAFAACFNLGKIRIPEGTFEIADTAFGYCIGLSEVTIPDSVTSIADDAFEGCTSLRAVHASPEWLAHHKGFLASLPAYDPEA